MWLGADVARHRPSRVGSRGQSAIRQGSSFERSRELEGAGARQERDWAADSLTGLADLLGCG